jgi:hypothetical protein
MTTIKRTIPSWVYEILSSERFSTYFVTGGLGSAKSTGAAISFIGWMLQHPQVKQWWAVAPTYTQAENALIPICIWVLEEFYGLKLDRDYRLLKDKPSQIVFKNGQKLYFHSGDRAERMVSATIGGYWISEAGIQKRTVYENCTARARDKKAGRLLKIVEGTPEGDGWYRDEADFHKVNKEKGYRRVILHTEDNKANLAADYIPNLLNVYANQPEKIKSYLFGEFASFNRGSAYWDFYESQNVILDAKTHKQYPIIITWDFNVSPLSWVAQQRQPFYLGMELTKLERLIALAESSGESRGLLNACAEFIKRFPPDEYKNTQIHIDGGHDGYASSMRADQCAFNEIRDLLRKYYSNVKIIAEKSAPRVKHRLERVNVLFAYKRYMISSECAKLIKSYNTACIKPGTYELEKKKGEDPTHYSDAGDYGAYNNMADVNLDGAQQPAVGGINRI